MLVPRNMFPQLAGGSVHFEKCYKVLLRRLVQESKGPVDILQLDWIGFLVNLVCLKRDCLCRRLQRK